MQTVPFESITLDLLRALPAGRATINTWNADGTPNAMTIGWATVGTLWAEPVLQIYVRESRHTLENLKLGGHFSVSWMNDQSQKQALLICGTKSGRDLNKFEAAGITAQPGNFSPAPIVPEFDGTVECEILSKTLIKMDEMTAEPQSHYKNGDYHYMLTGKILGCTVK